MPQEPIEAEGLLLDRLADFTTRARSAVEREGGSHEILVLPDPEMPARFALALLVLLDGLDLIGATRREAWRTLYRVAFDSIPRLRVRVLERLYEETEEVPTTEVLGDLPNASARRALEDVTVLGMVERTSGGTGKALTWALKKETREEMRFLKRAEETFSQKSHGGVVYPGLRGLRCSGGLEGRQDRGAKLITVLLREQTAHPAWWVAREAGVDQEYAEQALARMADWTPDEGDPSYPVLRRSDLGPDVVRGDRGLNTGMSG